MRLGRHFGKDHTTIIYNLRRFAPHLVGAHISAERTRSDYVDYPLTLNIPGRRMTASEMRRTRRLRLSITVIGPTTPCVALLPAPKPHPSMKYKHLVDDECIKVNPGKSYRQYRKEAKARTAAARAETMVRLKREYEERVKRRGRLSKGADYSGFKQNGWW